tara:strand:- start:94 stop:528 length:435 start_codon:yes stop_codon:yes gene_type:complete
MKKEQLRKALKPLIKECIKEVIFEEGILSGLIKEVATGLGTTNNIVESQQASENHEADFSRRQKIELQEAAKLQMEERKRNLEQSMGNNFSGIFENVEPIANAGVPSSNGNSSGPLSAYSPGDSGVDISGLMALGTGNNWKKMI